MDKKMTAVEWEELRKLYQRLRHRNQRRLSQFEANQARSKQPKAPSESPTPSPKSEH